MDDLSQEFKQKIVHSELKRLEEAEYISHDTYKEIVDAQASYYENLAQRRLEQVRAERARREEQLRASKPETSKSKQSVPLKKTEKQKVQPEPAPIREPVKKQLSPEEIRERNITWLLNLGVILLLFGGLILATSTWELLGDWMKAGLIALVSVLFFSLAFITTRLLKIQKTGFAFLVLGNLFLPIVILSAGHFELFGHYFSIYGEGQFFYGAAGSLVLLPLYFLFAIRLKSRLFIWFTYVILSTFASFLIGSFKLPVDGFYLAIMLFNMGLVAGFYYSRHHRILKQFTKEFVLYIQGNLVLSTLFMLIFFNSELIYSFNLLLTAVLFLAMIYVSNQKEYHFVFSALLVYGAYQFIEFSIVSEVSSVAYALLGFLFLAMPKFLIGQQSLQKAFRYTSALVSGLAFLYITVEGMLLNFNEPSILLFIAYIIISANFIFLVNAVKQQVFAYISSGFIMTALFEAILLGRLWFGYESIILPTFFAAILMYLGLGCFSKFKITNRIKASTRDITILVMMGLILTSFLLINWLNLAIMLLSLSGIMLFMYMFERRKVFVESEVASMTHGLLLALATNFFYLEWFGSGSVVPASAESLVVAGIVGLVASYIWKYMKQAKLYTYAFFVSQMFYVLGLIVSFGLSTEEITRTVIVFGGIGMAYLLYRKTKWIFMPYVVNGMFVLFYLTGLHALHTYVDITFDLFISLQYIGATLLLLGIASYIGKWDRQLQSTGLQVAHAYLPIALLVGYTLHGEISVWAFLIATIIYGLSSLKVVRELFIKVFLYGSFTSLWVFVSLLLETFELGTYFSYSFLIVTIVMTVLWYVSEKNWPKRIAYYLVPFSLIGMMSFIDGNPNTIWLLITVLVYGLIVLFVLHQEKWTYFSLVPLLISYLTVYIFGITGPFGVVVAFVLKAGFGITLIVSGQMLYQSLMKEIKGAFPLIDWYTIIGVGALFSLYLHVNEAIWMSIVPGVLIALFLFTQRKRIPKVTPNLILFAAIVYLIEPYYAGLSHLTIPDLFEVEMYVLPWVFFSILLKKLGGNIKDETVNYIQWVVLGISAIVLLQKTIISTNVYDALLFGVLSLISVLAGMRYQLRSFFLIGSGALLINVFFQTRPFWNAVPLWVYILVAGSILIGVASYNEYHKQKVADGKETLASNLKEKIIRKFKEWE